MVYGCIVYRIRNKSKPKEKKMELLKHYNSDPRILVVDDNKKEEFKLIVDVLMDEKLLVNEKILRLFNEFPDHVHILKTPFDFLSGFVDNFKPTRSLLIGVQVTLSNYKTVLDLDRMYNGTKSELDGMFDGFFSQTCVYGIILWEKKNGTCYSINCVPFFSPTFGRLVSLIWNGSKVYKPKTFSN
jgi:hypothetical protein